MSATTDRADLIVELRRDGERALSPNLQGLLDRAATALEQSELDLVEARNQFSWLLRSWRSGRVNLDFHRVYSEAQQKLTRQAATIAAVRTKAIALTCIRGHWRGRVYEDASEYAGAAILAIIDRTNTTGRNK